MSRDSLKVDYDNENKTWQSAHYPYAHVTNRSLGTAFLQSMRSLDAHRVLEYHYDENREKCVKDLYQESIIVGKNLLRLGMNKGDVVVLFSGYNYLTSSLTFGSILVGGVVNFFETNLDKEDIGKLLEVIQPFMILYEEVFLTNILNSLKRSRPRSLKYVFAIDGPGLPNVSEELLKSPGAIDLDKFEALHIEKPEREIAFLVLTSGSTGLPKVTQLTHCLLLNGVYIWWTNPCNHELPHTNSVLFSLSPLRWISQVSLLLQSAILGIKRICANKAGNGRYGLEILRKTRPTHIFSVPSFFHEILRELDEGDTKSLDSLKYIQLGGEPPSSIITNLSKRFALNSKLFYSYGMSEVSCSITNDEHISGGILQPGFQMQVLDDELLPLGHNQYGHLAVRTPYPFVGYRDKGRNEVYLESGFFLNGDYGYFDDSNALQILGRVRDLIRHDNILLIPNLIESYALKVPELSTSCLIGYHPSPGDAREVAALYAVLKEGVTASPEHISGKIRAAWSGHLLQEQISVIENIYFLRSLPLTSCGKIDRIALKKLALKMVKRL